MEKEIGIVLKRFFPQKQKISVLSKNHGKINLITPFSKNGNKLWPGTLIEFLPNKRFDTVTNAENLEIIDMPFENNAHNIYWQHFILELCYFFLPLNDSSPKVFDCLNFSLNYFSKINNHLRNNKLIKRFIIMYLFFLFGLYHDEKMDEIFLKYNLNIKMGVDFLSSDTVKSIESLLAINDKTFTEDIHFINDCILENLKEHPNSKFFKTKNFINFL